MDILEICQQIESPLFAGRVNLVGGFRAFLDALSQEQGVQKLLGTPLNRRTAEELLRRVLQLIGQRIDPRYENPFDAALSAYLWVLNATYPDLALIGTELILAAPNCWWANKLAMQILAGRTIKSEDVSCFLSEPPLQRRRVQEQNSEESGESVIAAGYSLAFAKHSTGLNVVYVTRPVLNRNSTHASSKTGLKYLVTTQPSVRDSVMGRSGGQ